MPEELVILVREVQARYHILYGRCVTQAKTRQAWEEIAAAINSTGLGYMRTATGCQKRNNDLKRRTRKKDKKTPQKQETKTAGEDNHSGRTAGVSYVCLCLRLCVCLCV